MLGKHNSQKYVRGKNKYMKKYNASCLNCRGVFLWSIRSFVSFIAACVHYFCKQCNIKTVLCDLNAGSVWGSAVFIGFLKLFVVNV